MVVITVHQVKQYPLNFKAWCFWKIRWTWFLWHKSFTDFGKQPDKYKWTKQWEKFTLFSQRIILLSYFLRKAMFKSVRNVSLDVRVLLNIVYINIMWGWRDLWFISYEAKFQLCEVLVLTCGTRRALSN